MVSLIAGVLLLSLVFAYLLTGLTRRFAVASNLLDVPNERSSHTRPTPRGGGVAIVVVFLAGAAAFGLWGLAPKPLALALIGGGAALAIVGGIDDRRGLSPGFRLLVQFAAAAWALFWLGGLPALSYGRGALALGVPGSVLGAIGIVWMINLYNFMDGIDGLAASEAVTTAGAAGLLLVVAGNWKTAGLVWVLCAAAIGFLIWNWSPAKIFMGDVGSGFLGYTLAVLALFTEQQRALPILLWAILLGVFLVDATATIVWRIQRGEKWHEAHRTHAFQRAVQTGFSHSQVTLTIIAINLILAGIAWLCLRYPTLLLPMTALVCLSLLTLWRRCLSLPVASSP